MTLIQEFKKLNGKEVTRNELTKLNNRAKKENNTEIVYRISRVLNSNPKTSFFKITVNNTGLNAPHHNGIYKEALTATGKLKKGWKFEKGRVVKVAKLPKPAVIEGKKINGKLKKGYKYVKGGGIVKVSTTAKKKTPEVSIINNEVPREFLAGLDFIEHDDTNLNALNAPNLSQKQIYENLTKNVIKAVKESSGNWSQEWGTDGYTMPFSFATKKKYKGGNLLNILSSLSSRVIQNPYFLTKENIDKLKGTLKKKAKKHKVIYYTFLYKFESPKKEKFTSYSKMKVIDFMISKGYNKKHFNLYVTSVPIIKQHVVYNGNDVTGIDFGLNKLTAAEKQKMGYVSTPNNKLKRNPIAELIIKNFPKKSAKIEHDDTFSPHYNSNTDVVRLPQIESFENSAAYYSTLFHEMAHSTGHSSRLNRNLKNRFGSVGYAKEELIAEFGAIFLSAQAGVFWLTKKSHAAYLKGWSSKINHLNKDPRLLMRAASEAQKAVDYLLQVNDKNEPLFFKQLQKQTQTTTKRKASATPPKKSINKTTLAKPIIKTLNKKSIAYKRQLQKNKTINYYNIVNNDLAKFLGKLEIKPKHSLVITISGEQGSGKTHFAFKFMSVLAQKYKIGHASMEEHPDSSIYIEKENHYFNNTAKENIDNSEIESLADLEQMIQENDVIVIDSFAKLKEMDNKFELDTHLRKKYDGKLFLIIFQQTSDNKMRGGSKSAYDGDIILYINKNPDYKQNYVYANKNRYQTIPLHELQYNTYLGKLNNINESKEIEF